MRELTETKEKLKSVEPLEEMVTSLTQQKVAFVTEVETFKKKLEQSTNDQKALTRERNDFQEKLANLETEFDGQKR